MQNQRYAMYFLKIQREANYLLNKKLKPMSLGRHDVRVLRVVNAEAGMTQNEICEELREDKITVSKAIKHLESRGYIVKRKNSDDKRITNIFMTNEGKQVREVIIDVLKDVNTSLTRDLNDEELVLFEDMLERVFNSVSKEAARLEVE